jgi:hypothetical protein
MRGFREWLLDKKFNRRYTSALFNYAQLYADCLFNRDLKRLQELPDSQRPNVMKALSALAKFLGLYDDWLGLVKNYGLSWAGRSTDDILIDRLTRVEDPDEVWRWVRTVKEARPELAELLDLMAVSGLRFIEGVHSVNLTVQLSSAGKLDSYFSAEKQALEHFRFKTIFLRRSKKAFVSFVPEVLVKRVAEGEIRTASAAQKLVQNRGLPLRFGDIREAQGTFMTRFLTAPEVDFLQGRVSDSVFMSNYFNPALISDLKERVFKGIQEIQQKIKTEKEG